VDSVEEFIVVLMMASSSGRGGEGIRTLCLYLYDGDNKNNLKRQKE